MKSEFEYLKKTILNIDFSESSISIIKKAFDWVTNEKKSKFEDDDKHY